ncbi:MAG TPA: carotenoid biosynthesis protein [Verrucomicrobiae bacterium]
METVPPELKPSPALKSWQKPFFVAFLVLWIAEESLAALKIDLPSHWRWLDAAFLAVTAFTTLLALGRRLPAQNVFMTAVVVLGLAGGLNLVAGVTGVPYGPIIYLPASGEKLFDVVPWSVPVLWLIVVVNGRGVARLIMRPWRKTTYYGFWVIGFTSLLAVIFDLGLEPYAVHVKTLWLWHATKFAFTWGTAPLVNFLGWFVTCLLILFFSVPWLINKQPVKQAMDYYPLITWLLLNILFLTGNAVRHDWPAVAVSAMANAFIATYAIRGARW